MRFTLEAPRELAKFIAPKGSVALDGTSLTVNKVDGTRFDVLLIHHSLGVTTWGERQAGDASISKSTRWRATRRGWPKPPRWILTTGALTGIPCGDRDACRCRPCRIAAGFPCKHATWHSAACGGVRLVLIHATRSAFMT